MSVAGKLRRAPTRIATGAFILNSGLQKLGGDDDAAKGVHGMASGAYPVVGNVQPKALLRVLGVGETALGGALLLPIIPARVAGAGLIGFSGALLGAWWRTPGMHDGLRPTQQGTAIAKDSWMLGIGTGLLIDDLISGASESHAVRKAERRAERKAGRRARKAEAKLQVHELKHDLKAASVKRRRQLRTVAKKRANQLKAETKAQAKAQAQSARKAAVDTTQSARKAAVDTTQSARKAAVDTAQSARTSAHQAGGSVRDAAAQAAQSVRSTAESVVERVGV